MSNRDEPRSFLPHSKSERDVNDLREYGIPSDVKVYKANSDGTKGELLREESPTFFHPSFIGKTGEQGAS